MRYKSLSVMSQIKITRIELAFKIEVVYAHESFFQ